MQKILICGATGFIGRNLTEYWAKQSDVEVHAVYHKRPPFSCQNVIWHQADLRQQHRVAALLLGMDVLIQAAATTSGIQDILTRPAIHVTDNAVMNSYLFRASIEHHIKHVVFFSCTVMYPSSSVGLKETDFDANLPINQRYFGVAHTKLYLEKMCEFYANISSTQFTAIRHSNLYGPHDKYDLERSHVFGATITKVMQASDTITVWGTGEEERDLLHVDDLVNFVALALAKQTDPFRLYHCGYGAAIAIKDLVAMIVKLSGKSLTILHDVTKPTIKTSLFLDCSRASNELGWKPKISLEAGIQKTLAWWLDHVGMNNEKSSHG